MLLSCILDMVVEGMASEKIIIIIERIMAKSIFIKDPANSTENLARKGFLVKELELIFSPSSPSILTYPPIGNTLRE